MYIKMAKWLNKLTRLRRYSHPKLHKSSQYNSWIWKWRQITTNGSTRYKVLLIIVVEPKEKHVLHNTKELSTLPTQLLHSAIGRVRRNSEWCIKHAQASSVHFTLPPGGVKEKQPLEKTYLGGISPAVSLYCMQCLMISIRNIKYKSTIYLHLLPIYKNAAKSSQVLLPTFFNIKLYMLDLSFSREQWRGVGHNLG